MLEKLTDARVRRTRPAERVQRLFDGGGLYLEITPTGGRLWRYKYRFGGKEKLLSLGTLEQKSLKEARAAHRAARELVASGVDPSVVRKIEKATRNTKSADSFEIIAREWHVTIHASKVSAGHADRTLIRLEQDIFPWLGALVLRRNALRPARHLTSALRRLPSFGSAARIGPYGTAGIA